VVHDPAEELYENPALGHASRSGSEITGRGKNGTPNPTQTQDSQYKSELSGI